MTDLEKRLLAIEQYLLDRAYEDGQITKIPFFNTSRVKFDTNFEKWFVKK